VNRRKPRVAKGELDGSVLDAGVIAEAEALGEAEDGGVVGE